MSIAILLSTLHEEVSRDLVGLNPDVNGAKDFPFVNWTVRLM